MHDGSTRLITARSADSATAWHHDSISSATPDLGALMDRIQHGDQAAFADL